MSLLRGEIRTLSAYSRAGSIPALHCQSLQCLGDSGAIRALMHGRADISEMVYCRRVLPTAGHLPRHNGATILTHPEDLDNLRGGMGNFPFETIEVAGSEALATWTQLRQAGRGYPVVLGDDRERAQLAEQAAFTGRRMTASDILAAAEAMHFPHDLIAECAAERTGDLYDEEDDNARTGWEDPIQALLPGLTREAGTEKRDWQEIADILKSHPERVLLGDWPSKAPRLPELTINRNRYGMLDKVHIGLIPTDDPTAVPAYLGWGGWNACPVPGFHVAALRSWRSRFGAELVGLNHDTMNLRVMRRPQTRDAAMMLAREHYLYCDDVVHQGYGTLRPLAAALMGNDWWWFWWD